jgi:hypothetical protein
MGRIQIDHIFGRPRSQSREWSPKWVVPAGQRCAPRLGKRRPIG